MAEAWLDSLSEDWVSQAPSEGSSQLPAAAPAHAPSSARPKLATSRLPRASNNNQNKHSGVRKPLSGSSVVNSSGILSERSISDRNIPECLRGVSARTSPGNTATGTQPRKYLSRRSVSGSFFGGSVIHNTVDHKILSSTSVGKQNIETPEWKRRLVQGDLGYGEQRDLFTSAATGLENIFNPPPSITTHPVAIPKTDEDEVAGKVPEERVESADQTPNFDTTVPSSPPIYRDNSTVEIHVNDSLSQLLPGENPEKGPRKAIYRRTDVTTPEDSALDQAVPADQKRDTPSQASWNDLSVVREPSTLLSAESFSQAPSAQAQAEARKFSKASTGSVLRNETFSPILLHKQSGEDGKPNYAPMDLPPTELRKRLDQLRRNQVIVTDPRNMDDAGAATRGQSAISIENTDDYEQAGGFINFRRGGRSADGSFRHRALSPELVGSNTSEMFPEESLQASTPKQFPGSVRTGHSTYRNLTPPPLKVPHPSPEKNIANRARGSSGSPLKLFGPYDTFTNQTLMRRISQLEDQMTDRSRSSGAESVKTSVEAASKHPNISRTGPAKEQGNSKNRDSSAFFGEGDLDGYKFQETFDYQAPCGSTFDGRNQPVNLVQDQNANHTSKLSMQFSLTHESSPPASNDLVINRQRSKSSGAQSTTDPGRRRVTPRIYHNKKHVPETPAHRDMGSDSKRPRASPTKDPTPKRRRTLHKSDISYVEELRDKAADAVQSSHHTMQSAISRNNRSYRDVEAEETFLPNVLANRHVLRPRTPTPSQRSVVQKDRKAFVQDVIDDSEMGESVLNGRNSVVRPSPLRPGDDVQEADRKPSIKTEDFLHEANKIMAIIRGGKPTRSGLNSVEESELENRDSQVALEDSFEESTREPFSRPPSREGPPLSRANTKQEDPEILERLKKYEERSEIGDIIGSSVRSLGLAQEVIRTLKEAEQQMQDTVAQSAAARRGSEESEQIISDLSNVRISRAPSMNHTEEPYDTNRSADGFGTHGTTSSAGHSTGRSIPTGSSRGSEARKTIAPQTVSHLIPDQVGNMFLDRKRNVWTKQKAEKSAPSQPARTSNILPSEASEDDPFADIPDLTVDMTMEMQRLRIQSLQKALSSPQLPREDHSSSPAGSPPQSPGRVAMADFVEQSSPRMPRGTPIAARGPTLITPAQSPFKIGSVLRSQVQDEVEHEIQVDEGRDGPVSSGRKRNLTITFSSPVASVIHDVIVDSSGEDQSMQDRSKGDISTNSIGRGRHRVADLITGAGGSARSTLASRSRSHGSMKHISMRGSQRFMPRPVSRIEERDEDDNSEADVLEQDQEKTQELSVVPEDSVVALSNQQSPRQASISFVLRTPGRLPAGHANAAAVLNEYVGNLSLTALSDFTVHNPEPSAMLEASYVIGDRRYVTGRGDKPVMSQSLQELVARLAEFEPFEPYWEDLTELRLNDKRLANLHKLDEFCGKIVRLDVSNNNISNLGGIPGTVRFLKISQNMLSDLTPWGALMNLQYLDVSNNDLKTLSGLNQLVHLRDLKADNCNLTSLEGIQFHEGLQILRARENNIKKIDLEHCNMASLFELDLADNNIKTVSHIENLGRLSILNLQRNKLEKLEIMSGKPFLSLRRLELDENSMASLDITLLPQIKVIHADKNKLQTLSGFNKATRLDSLSLREQLGDKPLDIMSFLDIACEVRKLFLSGNRLLKFNPQLDFMNLHLLELANCGIRSLPENAAELMQNLRKLNLNFNALIDVSCLANISRLKKLSLAGNRLENARDVVEVAEKLPNLTELDLRDNPCTLGLYPPSHVVITSGPGNPFVLAPGDPERDAAYCRRLDMGTRMHRRLYEIVWIHNTKKLRMLDGLPLDRNLANLRDDIWDSLVAYGLIVDQDQLGSKKTSVSRQVREVDASEAQTRGRSKERRNRASTITNDSRKLKTAKTDEARNSRTTTITSSTKNSAKSSRSTRKVTTVYVQTFTDQEAEEDGSFDRKKKQTRQRETTSHSAREVAQSPSRHNLTWGAEDTFA